MIDMAQFIKEDLKRDENDKAKPKKE